MSADPHHAQDASRAVEHAREHLRHALESLAVHATGQGEDFDRLHDELGAVAFQLQNAADSLVAHAATKAREMVAAPSTAIQNAIRRLCANLHALPEDEEHRALRQDRNDVQEWLDGGLPF